MYTIAFSQTRRYAAAPHLFLVRIINSTITWQRTANELSITIQFFLRGKVMQLRQRELNWFIC